MNEKISIVTSLYNSQSFLNEFIVRIISSLKKIKCENYEIIFVNDGSPDNSLEIVLDLQEKYKNIIILDLSRNFGHHNALLAGIKHSNGDLVLTIDNDLETPPEVLEKFYNNIKLDDSLDVVYGYQTYRKGAFFERFTGSLFWFFFNKLSPIKIPKNILTERLMKRNYINSLSQLNDKNVFLGGMFYWVGFNQLGVPISKGSRSGKSTYTLSKKINLMIHAITSFSSKPLEWMFKFGIGLSFFSGLFLVFIAIKKIVLGDTIQIGWTSIIALTLFVFGILSMFLGVIGIYLGRVFNQVQMRPNYIIKNIHE